MPVRVLLFEDNYTLREALSFMIGSTDGFELVGAFGDCLRAVEQVGLLKPDVVLMDIDLPGLDGIKALVNIKEKHPATDVLMLTVFDDEHIFEAIKAGAMGYLLKKTPPAMILEAIRQVAEGGAPMSPSIARKVMLSMHKPTNANNELERLSAREHQILQLLSEGLSYKMVAAQCGISLETVRTHTKRIYEKLHVNSVTEAISKLHKKGY